VHTAQSTPVLTVSPRPPTRIPRICGRALLAVAVVLLGVGVTRVDGASAQTSSYYEPGILGFRGDIQYPVELTVGGGAAMGGVGTYLAGGVTCTAATLGTCGAMMAAGVVVGAGAFVGTTMLLDTKWGCEAATTPFGVLSFFGSCPGDVPPPAALVEPVIQTPWKQCASGDFPPYTAIANRSAGLTHCSHLTIDAIPVPDSSYKWLRIEYCDGPQVAGETLAEENARCPIDGVQYCEASIEGSSWYKSGAMCQRNTDGVPMATALAVGRSKDIHGDHCDDNPGGTPHCGIDPGDYFRIKVANQQSGGTAHVWGRTPVSRQKAYWGHYRQVVTESRCQKPDASAITTVTANSHWQWDRDMTTERFPISFPKCPDGFNHIVRTTATLHTLGEARKTLLNINYPAGSREGIFDHRQCLTDNSCTRPYWDEEGECRWDDKVVDERWCLANAGEPDPNAPGVEIGVSPAPLEEVAPYPVNPAVPVLPEVEIPPVPSPQPEPEPGTSTTAVTSTTVSTSTSTQPEEGGLLGPAVDVDPENAECFPTGWGLLNPVDWILKPVKCALRWAFVPKTSVQTRVERLRTRADGSAIGTAMAIGQELTDGIGAGLGAAGGGSCRGPGFKVGGPDDIVHYPLSACEDPMATVAIWFRRLVACGIALLGAVRIYNHIVRPFGIEPIDTNFGPVEQAEFITRSAAR
jgi:hypothetical protein